jgi:hypothetical protein
MSTQKERPPTPPKLVAKDAIENGEVDDLIFTPQEFKQFDQHFKRRLAGAADTDEITGKSTMLEIQSYFCRQRSLGEYTE